jgi:two-component system, cell cycle sensor histidine kinase and response regulator CckA
MSEAAKETVLVVDDEPGILVALEDLLSDRFIVTTSSNGESALAKLEDNRDVAVVVTDQRMPKMPGDELLSRLDPECSAERILLTGFADVGAVIRAVNQGQIFAYVTKPWDPADLLGKVSAAAAHYRLGRELTNERKLFGELMNNVPDGVYFKDHELRFQRVNRAFAGMLGFDDATSVLGKHLGDLGTTDLLQLAQDDEEVLRGDRSVTDRVYARDSAIGTRWYSETKVRILSSGQPGIVGIVRDVTERLAAAEALKTSEQRLREQSQLLNSILQSMEEGVIVADSHMGIVMANPPAQRLLGLEAGGASGVDWASRAGLSLTHEGKHIDPHRDPLLRAIAGEYTPMTEVTRTKVATDEARLAITGLPLEDNGKLCGGIVVVRDVTEQRRLEQQLLQAQKVEAIGQLASGVAHDFNNMLSIIVGYGQMLRSTFATEDPRRDDVQELLGAAERAGALTQQLLAFGRIKQAVPTRLCLNDVLVNFERLMRRALPSNVELTTFVDPEAGDVRLDAGQVEQVLLNLVVNARDAMPRSGGHIRVSTTSTHRSTKALKQGQDAPFVVLSVEDDGGGIPAEVRERIFEPFFTTKAVGVGTGLGLSTVFAVAKQAGGFVEVDSSPGVGACFRIYLPACVDEVAEGPTSSRSAEAPGLERVLVVDEDPGMRRTTARTLRANGYTVFAANGLEQAQAIMQGQRIDAIVTELSLAQSSGSDVVLRLLEDHPAAGVVLMSVRPRMSPTAIQPTRGTQYVQKPFHPAALLRAVRASTTTQ